MNVEKEQMIELRKRVVQLEGLLMRARALLLAEKSWEKEQAIWLADARDLVP